MKANEGTEDFAEFSDCNFKQLIFLEDKEGDTNGFAHFWGKIIAAKNKVKVRWCKTAEEDSEVILEQLDADAWSVHQPAATQVKEVQEGVYEWISPQQSPEGGDDGEEGEEDMEEREDMEAAGEEREVTAAEAAEEDMEDMEEEEEEKPVEKEVKHKNDDEAEDDSGIEQDDTESKKDKDLGAGGLDELADIPGIWSYTMIYT